MKPLFKNIQLLIIHFKIIDASDYDFEKQKLF